jgi:hypothetical protein
MGDVMYDPPAYLWAITIAGPTAIAALTCAVLYGGAPRPALSAADPLISGVTPRAAVAESPASRAR